MTQNKYARRDVEKQGEHYTDHVFAMTVEHLHSKADIAAELAHRDIIIEELRLDVRLLESDLREIG